MIAYIEGRIIDTTEHYLVILAHGVGYRVFCPETILSSRAIDTDTGLFTHLAVRENAMDLYGFETKEELVFFELLISISGIGPKSALAILNIADIATLRSAIAQNDHSYLTKVSGIGAKSAKKIVLELQGKIGVVSEEEQLVRKDDLDVHEALKSLGYGEHEIRQVLKDLPTDIEGTNARIKEALKQLGK